LRLVASDFNRVLQVALSPDPDRAYMHLSLAFPISKHNVNRGAESLILQNPAWGAFVAFSHTERQERHLRSLYLCCTIVGDSLGIPCISPEDAERGSGYEHHSDGRSGLDP